MPRTPSLTTLDEALIQLRRLWAAGTPRSAARPGGSEVEMSTVLIADALDRLDADDHGTPPTVTAVAARLDVAPSTASRLVDRAVAAGIVHRERSARDVRRAALGLTAAGRVLAEEATRFRLGYLARLTRDWDDADVDLLARLLHRFAGAVHDQPAAHAAPARPPEDPTHHERTTP